MLHRERIRESQRFVCKTAVVPESGCIVIQFKTAYDMILTGNSYVYNQDLCILKLFLYI